MTYASLSGSSSCYVPCLLAAPRACTSNWCDLHGKLGADVHGTHPRHKASPVSAAMQVATWLEGIQVEVRAHTLLTRLHLMRLWQSPQVWCWACPCSPLPCSLLLLVQIADQGSAHAPWSLRVLQHNAGHILQGVAVSHMLASLPVTIPCSLSFPASLMPQPLTSAWPCRCTMPRCLLWCCTSTARS